MSMLIDCVALTQKAFNKLMEYSMSLPTATTIGKQWKRKCSDGWYLCEYKLHPTDPENKVMIESRKIVIREAGLKTNEVVGQDEAYELWCKEREAAKA